MQRGLVEFEDVGAGQVGITALGGQRQPRSQATVGEPQGSPLDPIFASTSWTREDVQTLASVATVFTALIALWRLENG